MGILAVFLAFVLGAVLGGAFVMIAVPRLVVEKLAKKLSREELNRVKEAME